MHGTKGLGYDVDVSHNTNWSFPDNVNFFKYGKDCISVSDFCASASAGRSYISICTANVGRDRQSATTFWLPFTWAISEINSVIIASCLRCLSDLAGFRLWNAPHIGLWSVRSNTSRSSMSWRKCNTDKYAAKSSRSKVEYLVCVVVSFFEKNPIGIGFPFMTWCKAAPTAYLLLSVTSWYCVQVGWGWDNSVSSPSIFIMLEKDCFSKLF